MQVTEVPLAHTDVRRVLIKEQTGTQYILVRWSSPASPFVVTLRAESVVSLVAYHFSFVSFRRGGIVCDSKIFSIFSGISL